MLTKGKNSQEGLNSEERYSNDEKQPPSQRTLKIHAQATTLKPLKTEMIKDNEKFISVKTSPVRLDRRQSRLTSKLSTIKQDSQNSHLA